MKLPQKLEKQNGHRGDSAYLHYPLARANNGSLRCWYIYFFLILHITHVRQRAAFRYQRRSAHSEGHIKRALIGRRARTARHYRKTQQERGHRACL